MRDGAIALQAAIPSPSESLAELARSLLAEVAVAEVDDMTGVPGDDGILTAVPRTVLSLADIVADDTGACVLDVDGPNVAIELRTDETVVAEGAADPFASAAGSDVSGHAFITFASGVTIYFPPDLDVALAPVPI